MLGGEGRGERAEGASARLGGEWGDDLTERQAPGDRKGAVQEPIPEVG